MYDPPSRRCTIESVICCEGMDQVKPSKSQLAGTDGGSKKCAALTISLLLQSPAGSYIRELVRSLLIHRALATWLFTSRSQLFSFTHWAPLLFSLLPSPSPPHLGAKLHPRFTTEGGTLTKCPHFLSSVCFC